MSRAARPILEVHKRVAHFLNAGQRVLEPLPCFGEFLPHSRVHAQCLQRYLFELFGREKLPQGEDKLPRIDLTGAEPGEPVVIVALDAQDGQLDRALPPLRF